MFYILKEILDGISKSLYNSFQDVTIHNELVKQGFSSPCFFISCLKVIHKKRLGRRYILEYPFKVQYFSKEGKDIEENFQICQSLFEVLSYIEVNEMILKGENITYEVFEGSITFYVTYEVCMEEEIDESELMEKLKLTN